MTIHLVPDDAAAAEADVVTYRRLAAIDPPALLALIEHLQLSAQESDQLAAEQPSPLAVMRANRDSRRLTAAHGALESSEHTGS